MTEAINWWGLGWCLCVALMMVMYLYQIRSLLCGLSVCRSLVGGDLLVPWPGCRHVLLTAHWASTGLSRLWDCVCISIDVHLCEIKYIDLQAFSLLFPIDVGCYHVYCVKENMISTSKGRRTKQGSWKCNIMLLLPLATFGILLIIQTLSVGTVAIYSISAHFR